MSEQMTKNGETGDKLNSLVMQLVKMGINVTLCNGATGVYATFCNGFYKSDGCKRRGTTCPVLGAVDESAISCIHRKPNASVSISGYEPEYDPVACSVLCRFCRKSIEQGTPVWSNYKGYCCVKCIEDNQEAMIPALLVLAPNSALDRNDPHNQ